MLEAVSIRPNILAWKFCQLLQRFQISNFPFRKNPKNTVLSVSQCFGFNIIGGETLISLISWLTVVCAQIVLWPRKVLTIHVYDPADSHYSQLKNPMLCSSPDDVTVSVAQKAFKRFRQYNGLDTIISSSKIEFMILTKILYVFRNLEKRRSPNFQVFKITVFDKRGKT